MIGPRPLDKHEIGVMARWLGYSRHIGLLILQGDGVCTNLTFEKAAADSIIERPSLSISPEQAQSLMDDLWACGLRPTQGRQSEGVTSAQEAHLQDMRALAFAKLGVAKP